MPERYGTFNVKDWEFPVTSAQLWGDIDIDGLIYWTFELHTDEGPEGFSPSAYFVGIPWRPKKVSDFARLAVYVPDGKAFCSGSIMPGLPMCAVFLPDGEHLRQSEFRITGYAGTKLDVAWNGRFDLLFSDEYGRDVPMEIRTHAFFIGLRLPWENESEAREKALGYFDTAGMHFHRNPHDSSSWLLTDIAYA